jgi:hypothetical protein
MEPARDSIPFPRAGAQQRPAGRAALTRLRRRRAALLSRLWLVGAWLASRRRPRVLPEDVARHIYRSQTRGGGLRMTEWLRDRLRPAWLRLRKGGQESS